MTFNIPKILNTWRHGRGFGVHSPLAFHLLADVIRRPKGASYYDETTLAESFVDRKHRRAARIAFRLAADCRPMQVTLLVSDNDMTKWRNIIASAAPHATISATYLPSDSQMIIVDNISKYDSMVAAGDESRDISRTILFTGLDDRNLRRAFVAGFTKGTFPGLIIDSRRHLAIAVRRRGLPRQVFSARF